MKEAEASRGRYMGFVLRLVMFSSMNVSNVLGAEGLISSLMSFSVTFTILVSGAAHGSA